MEYTPRLKQKYLNEVVNNLKGNYKSVMQVPRLVKICLNQGIGSASSDKKQIEAAQNEMTMITGQKAVLTKSTKDISNFKVYFYRSNCVCKNFFVMCINLYFHSKKKACRETSYYIIVLFTNSNVHVSTTSMC